MSGVLDAVLFLVVLMGFVLAGFVSVMIVNEVNDDIQLDSSINNNSKILSANVTSSAPAILDFAFLFLFVGFWMVLLILNYFLDSNPVFFVLTFIVMFAVMYVAGAGQDFFADLMLDGDFGALQSSFPIMSFVMNHFFMFFLVQSVTLLVVLYAKVRGGQNT